MLARVVSVCQKGGNFDGVSKSVEVRAPHVSEASRRQEIGRGRSKARQPGALTVSFGQTSYALRTKPPPQIGAHHERSPYSVCKTPQGVDRAERRRQTILSAFDVVQQLTAIHA